MPDYLNADRYKFFNISRGAELISLSSGDVMAFIPDIVTKNAVSGMSITLSDGAVGVLASPTYAATGTDVAVVVSNRVLLFARVTSGGIANGFRWVPWIDGAYSSGSDNTVIRPFREVYSPRVIYDANANLLTMFFWTNVNTTHDTFTYSYTDIYPIGDSDYGPLITATAGQVPAKRVLCCAQGSIRQVKIAGGIITGLGQPLPVADSPDLAPADDVFEMVPIFNRPWVVNSNVPAGYETAPGIITDGWYGTTTPDGGGGVRIPKDLIYSAVSGQCILTTDIIRISKTGGELDLEWAADEVETIIFTTEECEP